MTKRLDSKPKADILIVDDTPNNLRLLGQILGKQYKVRLAPSGQIALAAARSAPPDLILLDVMMPEMNGYEAAGQLKAEELTKEIPIIFISALDDTDSKVRAFAAGGVDYVTKPFQEREVLARVETHLSLRSLYKQAQAEIAERKRVEKALRETEELFALFMRYSPIYTYIKSVTSTESRTVVASDNFIDMIGISGSEMTGKTMAELFPAEFAAKITADDWAVISKGEVLKLDEELNGRHYTTIKFPIVKGDQTLLAGYTIDITDRKRAEENVRQLSRAVEASPTSIVITDLKGDIQYANPKFTQVTGYTLAEVLGKNPRILQSGQTPTAAYNELWETVPNGKEWHGEFSNRKKNGEIYWESASISPITDENGVIKQYVAVKEDITERKRTEAALKESEEKYHKIFNNEIDAICIVDVETKKILDVNGAYLKLYGYTREEILELTTDEINAEPENTNSIIQKAQETGDVVIPERNHRKKDGTIFQVELSAGAYTWKGRNVMFTIARDITERKQAEQTLRDSEDKFKYIFDHSVIGKSLTLASASGEMNVNQALCEMLGYSREELQALKWDEITHLEDVELTQRQMNSLLSGEKEAVRFTKRFVKKNGSILWADLSSTLRRDQDGKPLYFMTSINDITERKRAEESLLHRNQEMATLYETSLEINALSDISDLLHTIVRRACELLKIPSGALYLTRPDEELELEVGYQLPTHWIGAKIKMGEGVAGRVVQTKKPVLVEDYLNWKGRLDTFEDSPARRVLGVPLKIHDQIIGAIVLLDKQVGPFSADEIRLASLFADQATVAVTNAQFAAQLEERVVQRTSDLEAANRELESLSYNIAHDLRSPVRAMVGYAGILHQTHQAQLDAEGLKLLGNIRSSGLRLGQLIDGFLAFLRMGHITIHLQPVSMQSLVSQVLTSLKTEQKNRQIEFSLGNLPECQADPKLLEQVWVQLISNALKFTRPREVARIEIGSGETDGKQYYFVRDNGVGFEMKYSAKLFGVFQKLHPEAEYEGTGIGLAIVERILKRHGGNIWAESDLEKGSTFYFSL